MARTVDEIVNQIDTEINSKSSLAPMAPNPSKSAFWKDFRHTFAVAIAYFEQLLDKFKSDVEAKVDVAGVGTMPWLRQKAFEFQYDATNPQVVTLVNYIPKYAVVDETKRIVTICAATFPTSRTIDLAVAKGSPPGPLSAGELTAIQSYFTGGGSNIAAGEGIGVAGVGINVVTYNPDLLYMVADIYYDGLYTNVIKANVIAAIEKYLLNLGLTGIIKTIDLVDAIQSVQGVNDVFIHDLGVRIDGSSFSSPDDKVYLIQSDTELITKITTQSGYAVGETTTSNTLTDTLTFIVG